jgi:hypothetical protein
MTILNFKNWLESEEYYDNEYRQEMDRAHSNNPTPFAKWFPEGQNRIYLPFNISGDDQSLRTGPAGVPLAHFRHYLDMLLKPKNFNLADFRKGLAAPLDNPNRKQRIIPILNSIKTPENASYIEDAIKDYEKLTFRLNPGNNPFTIAITQDPHDIAKMSYDRHWKLASCMRLHDDKLRGGEKWTQVFEEVADGGLAAYLIDPEDKEIKKPYARVLLRKFENKTTTIALCEQTVYGIDVPNFLSTIREWLEQKQGRNFGTFNRKGSEWSDTFDRQHTIMPKHYEYTRDNQDKLMEMLKSAESTEFFTYAESIIAAYGAHKANGITPEFAKSVISMLNDKCHETKPPVRSPYHYYIPNIARKLDMPLEDVENLILKAPIETVAFNIANKSESDDLVKYLLPAFIKMAKSDNIDLESLSNSIDSVRTFQSEEFLGAFDTESQLELLTYVTDHDAIQTLNDILVHKLHHIAKQYHRGITHKDEITAHVSALLDKTPELEKSLSKFVPQEIIAAALTNA